MDPKPGDASAVHRAIKLLVFYTCEFSPAYRRNEDVLCRPSENESN